MDKNLNKLKALVGQRVRELRECKSLSKTQFADLLGKERKDVIDIEKGERNLTLKTLLQLAEVLEVEVITLLDFTNQLGSLPTQVTQEPKKTAAKKKTAKTTNKAKK